MKLIIQRKTEYWDVARRYKLYVDGAYLGSLKNGQIKSFSVAEGKHTIRVKQAFSFHTSKEYTVEGEETFFAFFRSFYEYNGYACYRGSTLSPTFRSSE